MDLPHPSRPISSRPLLIGSAAAAVAALLIVGGGHLVPAPADTARDAAPIPGATIVDEASMPVVTSLRSHGLAEQAGVRVGDRIAAVDGEPVRDLAQVDRAIRAGRPGPVSLHIQRGDAIWTVAIDRPEPEHQGKEPHDPQDIAG